MPLKFPLSIRNNTNDNKKIVDKYEEISFMVEMCSKLQNVMI